MPKDKITELRDAQRGLDRAIARRARVKKALDKAENDVRLRRQMADALMREVQLGLDQAARQAGFDLGITDLPGGAEPRPE